MLRQDHVLRLIRQLGEVFARLMGRVQGAAPEEVEPEVDRALKDLSGLSLDLIRALSLRGLLEVLRGGDAESARILAAADLLYVHARVRTAAGDEDAALFSSVRALTLYLETFVHFDHEALGPARQRAEDLVTELRGVDLPEPTLLRLWGYFEAAGRYARAEDVLFELLERDQWPETLVTAGVTFYERLLTRGDAELEAGDLPRDEVEESLQLLRQRL
jgi:hypothetical protein